MIPWAQGYRWLKWGTLRPSARRGHTGGCLEAKVQSEAIPSSFFSLLLKAELQIALRHPNELMSCAQRPLTVWVSPPSGRRMEPAPGSF